MRLITARQLVRIQPPEPNALPHGVKPDCRSGKCAVRVRSKAPIHAVAEAALG